MRGGGHKILRAKRLEQEKDIQKRIVDFLEAHGFMVFQNRSDGLGGKIAAFATTKQSGSPDLFVWGRVKRFTWHTSEEPPPHNIWEPIHFAVEVKRKGGKQSPAQIAWAGRFAATGHLYILASDHETVEKALRERGWL